MPDTIKKGHRAWAIMMKNPAGDMARAAKRVGFKHKTTFSYWIANTGRSGVIQTIRAKRFLPLISKQRSPRV